MDVLFWALLWYLSGVVSFIFWWTKQFDFTTDDLATAAFVSCTGPFVFIIGYSIHGDHTSVVLKKRK